MKIVRITGSEYMTIKTLFHAADDISSGRPVLAAVYYDPTIKSLVACDGQILRVQPIATVFDTPIFFDREQFKLSKSSLKAKYEKEWETVLIDVQTEYNDRIYPDYKRIVPVPKSTEDLKPKAWIGVDFYLFNSFLASYTEDPGSLVVGFNEGLKGFTVYNKENVFQGMIMPCKSDKFAPLAPFKTEPVKTEAEKEKPAKKAVVTPIETTKRPRKSRAKAAAAK